MKFMNQPQQEPNNAHPHLSSAARAKRTEAEQARKKLALALKRAGVQLPALDVCLPRIDRPCYALIDLGLCSAPVAEALAPVIARGADR